MFKVKESGKYIEKNYRISDYIPRQLSNNRMIISNIVRSIHLHTEFS